LLFTDVASQDAAVAEPLCAALEAGGLAESLSAADLEHLIVQWQDVLEHYERGGGRDASDPRPARPHAVESGRTRSRGRPIADQTGE